MKRVELLEALYLQGKKMRELQVYYFSLRKGGRRFSSPEAKKVLAQSKLEELQYDKMVTELDEWWDDKDGTLPAPLSDHNEASPEQESQDAIVELAIPEGWFKVDNDEYPETGNYLDVMARDGRIYKKIFFHRNLDKLRWLDKLNVIAWNYSDTTNDGDDDIRI